MDRRFEYDTLTDLIRDFDESYVSHDICLPFTSALSLEFSLISFSEGVHAHVGSSLHRSSIAPRIRIEDAYLLEGGEDTYFVQELRLHS